MSITYTPNYNLGKQENIADRFIMKVITDNMDIIDSALKSIDIRTDSGSEITDGTDMNEVTDSGIHFIENESNIINAPISGSAIVIVIGGIIQLFIASEFNGMFYMRLIGAEWYSFSGREVTI